MRCANSDSSRPRPPARFASPSGCRLWPWGLELAARPLGAATQGRRVWRRRRRGRGRGRAARWWRGRVRGRRRTEGVRGCEPCEVLAGRPGGRALRRCSAGSGYGVREGGRMSGVGCCDAVQRCGRRAEARVGHVQAFGCHVRPSSSCHVRPSSSCHVQARQRASRPHPCALVKARGREVRGVIDHGGALRVSVTCGV